VESIPTSRSALVAWLRAPIVALTFLTIVPIGKRITVADDELPRAIGFFPLIGLLLGLATAGIGLGLSSRMTPTLGAIVAAAWMALVTGALHLDGVGDLFDAVAGARGDRKRALAILRDPRMGSAGTVALVLVLLMQVAATARIIESAQWTALVVAPLVSRALVVPLVALFAPARGDGRAYAFAPGPGPGRVAIVVALGIVVPVLVVASPGVAPLGAAFLATTAVVLVARSVLGGMTGDVYGAAIALSEVAFLATCAG
jgi:adenosylcobinamide-GDP ribazoletransferase